VADGKLSWPTLFGQLSFPHLPTHLSRPFEKHVPLTCVCNDTHTCLWSAAVLPSLQLASFANGKKERVKLEREREKPNLVPARSFAITVRSFAITVNHRSFAITVRSFVITMRSFRNHREELRKSPKSLNLPNLPNLPIAITVNHRSELQQQSLQRSFSRSASHRRRTIAKLLTVARSHDCEARTRFGSH
jgi:hypothetical protein